MEYQQTFQRYETKYLLTMQEKATMLQAIAPYMQLDQYGRTTVRSLYFDTENYQIIRHSLERPAYREKLRIRSYKTAGPEDMVFVEIKKKYHSVVYKRRLALPEKQVRQSFTTGQPLPVHSQIGNEIAYMRQCYGPLRPAMFLSAEREAYFARDGGELRITFDENILYRDSDFSLSSPAYGKPLLEPEQSLMEIKAPYALPLWLCHAIHDCGIRRATFSKYGTAYRRMQEEKFHANDERRTFYEPVQRVV